MYDEGGLFGGTNSAVAPEDAKKTNNAIKVKMRKSRFSLGGTSFLLIANENKRNIFKIEIYFRISQTMLGSKKPVCITQLICRGRFQCPCIQPIY